MSGTKVGKKATRAQILESLLEPSKKVEPQWVTYMVETTDGRVVAEGTHRELLDRVPAYAATVTREEDL